jgi:sulfur-oxidizing protein SoxY
MDANPIRTFSRRDLLIAAAASSAGALLVSIFPVPADATPADVQKYLSSILPGTYQQGKITISAPQIAENGNTVPIGISIDSPMTPQNYVKTIVVAADGNPLPGVAKIDLSPANGQADVQFRIRLAQTQTITAVAQMSDGSLYSASRLIKVTIGGCGG